jgi:hypothetical protein
MKGSVLLDTTPCIPLRVNRRFGETCRLHLQVWRMSHAKNQSACYLLYSSFLLRLFFDHEGGVVMFFRNVGWLSADYSALHLRGENKQLFIITAARTSVYVRIRVFSDSLALSDCSLAADDVGTASEAEKPARLDQSHIHLFTFHLWVITHAFWQRTR